MRSWLRRCCRGGPKVARPPPSVCPGGLSGVCSDVACRVAILRVSYRNTERVPHRLREFCLRRNAERRESPRQSSGAARPRRPCAPFLWIAKERGERKLAPGDVPGAFARDALRPPRAPARPRRCESRAHRPTRKSPAARMRPPGAKKTPRRPAHKKRTTTGTVSVRSKYSARIRFIATRRAASF